MRLRIRAFEVTWHVTPGNALVMTHLSALILIVLTVAASFDDPFAYVTMRF